MTPSRFLLIAGPAIGMALLLGDWCLSEPLSAGI